MKKICFIFKTIDYMLRVVLFIIACFSALCLSICTWAVIIFYIANVTYLHYSDTFIVFKHWGMVALGFMFMSHVLFHIAMYTKIRDRLIALIKSYSMRWITIFALGYINSYFLDIYYIYNKYDEWDLRHHNTPFFMPLIAMLPVLNALCYIDMIRSLRKHVVMPSNRELINLYLKGQLMTYIIREYDDYDL